VDTYDINDESTIAFAAFDINNPEDLDQTYAEADTIERRRALSRSAICSPPFKACKVA